MQRGNCGAVVSYQSCVELSRQLVWQPSKKARRKTKQNTTQEENDK